MWRWSLSSFQKPTSSYRWHVDNDYFLIIFNDILVFWIDSQLHGFNTPRETNLAMFQFMFIPRHTVISFHVPEFSFPLFTRFCFSLFSLLRETIKNLFISPLKRVKMGVFGFPKLRSALLLPWLNPWYRCFCFCFPLYISILSLIPLSCSFTPHFCVEWVARKSGLSWYYMALGKTSRPWFARSFVCTNLILSHMTVNPIRWLIPSANKGRQWLR